MKTSAFLPILAGLIGAANAHSRVFSLWVNGVDQGDGTKSYIRSPPSNSPVKEVTSSDIICNVANTAAPSSVEVNAGDEVAFEWYHDNRGDDIIDASHKGPITVYIADAATNGEGDVWTKLAEDGLTDGEWAVIKLIANGGKHSVILPSSLAPGDYLLRAEIIALHESETDYAKNAARGAQFYPSCSQITVKSGGSTKPPGNFNFVGGYTHDDPGILFDLYSSPTSYPIPGPAVWDGASTGGDSSPSSSAPAATTSVVAEPTPEVEEPEVEGPEVEEPAPEPTTAPEFEEPIASPSFSSEVAAPTSAPVSSAVPTTLATRTRTRIRPTVSTPSASSAAAPKPTPKTEKEINQCLDEVNACIRQSQSSIGGVANFEHCESRRKSCYN